MKTESFDYNYCQQCYGEISISELFFGFLYFINTILAL